MRAYKDESRGAPTAAARSLGVEVIGGDLGTLAVIRTLLETEGLAVNVGRSAIPHTEHAAPPILAVVVDPVSIESVRAARDGVSAGAIVLMEGLTRDMARALLDAGASAVMAPEDMIQSLGVVARAVIAGQICLPSRLAGPADIPALSTRERQVLALMTAGLTNAEIARRLVLSESTVKSHAARAFRRLGVHSRREAVALILGSSDGLRRSILMAQPRPIMRPEGFARR